MRKIVNRVLVDCTDAEVIEMQSVTNKANSSSVILAALEFDIRDHRDHLLANTDWTALVDGTLSTAMAAYRQALRDVPAQEGFPHTVTWPSKP